jgi:hypothetical protein
MFMNTNARIGPTMAPTPYIKQQAAGIHHERTGQGAIVGPGDRDGLTRERER